MRMKGGSMTRRRRRAMRSNIIVSLMDILLVCVLLCVYRVRRKGKGVACVPTRL